MASATIKSMGISPESGFGNLDSNGIPDGTGLTYVSMEIARAGIDTADEIPQNERLDARAASYELPPEPDTAWESGARIQMATGTITIEMPYRGIGTPAAPFLETKNLQLGIMLSSVLSRMVATAVSDAPSGAVGVNEFTPGVLGNLSGGQIFGLLINNRAEYSAVTDKPANVIHSPALSAGAQPGDTLRLADTYYIDDCFAHGDSFALRLDGCDFRRYAMGCRLQSLSLTLAGRQLRWTAVIQSQFIYNDNANAATVDPQLPAGQIAHLLESYVVMSNSPVNGVTAPAQSGRTTLQLNTFDATLTFGLGNKGTSENAMGVAEIEPFSFTAEITMNASIFNATPEDSFWEQGLYELMIGFGPLVGVGGTPLGGVALYIPAALMSNDVGRFNVAGEELVTYDYNFKAGGPWTGDVQTAGAAGSIFRIGLLN